MSQFSACDGRATLADYIDIPAVYPAGRLDYDSEGLMILTGDGQLQHRISHPQHKLSKCYWAQVEGQIDPAALKQLTSGVALKDGPTLPARASAISQPPGLWPRQPPVRFRAAIPTSWLSLQISEGRNRQVRRMTAAVGFPTLRLIRASIGPWSLDDLKPGDYRRVTLDDAALQALFPASAASRTTSRTTSRRPRPAAKRGRKAHGGNIIPPGQRGKPSKRGPR